MATSGLPSRLCPKGRRGRIGSSFEDLDAFVERTAERRLADYLDLLRIPSIGTLSENDADTRATAQFVADRFAAMGFEHVEVSPTGGHPMVYADWLHAEGAPTVIVYAHYDVQPVDPLDLWVRPPFDPVVERRPRLRPWRGRRQVPRPSPPVGRTRLAGDARQAADQHQDRHGGRGGVRLGQFRAVARRQPRSAQGGPRSSSATRASTRATCRR